MLSVLDRIFREIQHGPHERKVKKYLNDATQDSIFDDLQRLIEPNLRVRERLWAVFNEYCVKDSSAEPYWDNSSFRAHIQFLHPDASMSETTIQLLWRCFTFYAYFPFPRHTTNLKIDLKGFQRVVLLLPIQCTDQIRLQDFDYYWDHDEGFFRKVGIQRILRSLSILRGTKKKTDDRQANIESTVNDIIDVISITQPQTGFSLPVHAQLESVARRLLGDGAVHTRSLATSDDLVALLSLLLRLRLVKEKWGTPGFHFGMLDPEDPRITDLAGVMVSGLGDNQETLTRDQIDKVTAILPNFQLLFHQLWAVLFQPPRNPVDGGQEVEVEALPPYIIAAISLVIPHSSASGLRWTPDDIRITLERSLYPGEVSVDFSATALVKSLAEDACAHVILFSSDKNLSKAAVVGAYFPRPLWIKPTWEEKKRKLKAGTTHLLFQLQPEFRILRWAFPEVSVADVINVDGVDTSLEAIANCDGTDKSLGNAYRIGDPLRKGTGLYVDPKTRSVVLKNLPMNSDGGNIAWYNQVCVGGEDEEKGWEVMIESARLDIYKISGTIEETLGTGRIVKAIDQAQYIHEETGPRVNGEELAQRIEGFGSASLK